MSNSPITIDADILSGEPVFTGTRVPVRALFDYVDDGMSISDFMENYPSVTQEMVHLVLRMAANRVCAA